jgi:glycosyltransferase involved in cell wall biosynthesis
VSSDERKFVGVIGSGAIGRDPFDRRSWSGISYFFFTELQRRGLLHRAFGVEVGQPRRAWLMALNFDRSRRLWRRKFHLDVRYREALTTVIGRRIAVADRNHSFLQIGGMYDVPHLLGGQNRCYLYADGNLAVSARNPFASERVSPRRIDQALAFERRVYHGQTRIFTMSEYLRNSFVDDFGVPAERVVTIGGAINLDAIPQPVAGKRYDTQQLLFVGIDFERKGGWIVLEAFQRLRNQFPRAVLHIVGPSRLAIPPQLQSGVVFHGYLSKSDPQDKAKIEELFRRCVLFVMPSLYEPFGIAPLEAMVHEIPCLVSDGWALRETVRPGQNGATVAVGSVEDLEEKLESLLGDEAALERMGKAGREVVLQHFTWGHVVERLTRCLSTTVG